MTYLIIALVVFFGSFLALAYMWPLVTAFARAREDGTLTSVGLVLGGVAYVIGYALDIWCGLLSNVLFLELANPRKEPTVSDRLRRLVHTAGWRCALAMWVSIHLVNPYSVGGPHIEFPTA